MQPPDKPGGRRGFQPASIPSSHLEPSEHDLNVMDPLTFPPTPCMHGGMDCSGTHSAVDQGLNSAAFYQSSLVFILHKGALLSKQPNAGWKKSWCCQVSHGQIRYRDFWHVPGIAA